MPAERFNRWWLTTFLGLCALQVLVSVIADPYCVFGILRYPKRNFEPNTRFLKIEYLRRHPEYDAFILGSSRASFLGATSARSACGPDRRYFNLNASLENGAGIRQKLAWLTRTREVRQVVINVDFDLQSVLSDPLDLLRQEHPLIGGSRETTFYAKYLLFQPRILYLYLLAQFRTDGHDPWNRGNEGVTGPLYSTSPALDLGRLYATTLGAVATDLSRQPDASVRATARGPEEFRRTMEIVARAGSEVVLVVPPYALAQYAGFSIDAYSEWMRRVVSDAGQVWDFSGYNPVTADARNYFDPVHFNESIGDRMLRRACRSNDDGADEDFGVRVTPENVERHIAAHRRQHEAARAAIAGGS